MSKRAKYSVDGVTLRRPKLSIFPHPDLHQRIREAAAAAGQSLSDWAVAKLAAALKWKDPK